MAGAADVMPVVILWEDCHRWAVQPVGIVAVDVEHFPVGRAASHRDFR